MTPGEWVVVDSIARRKGRLSFFWKWTGIGPAFTNDIDEACRFPTEDMAAVAVRHPMVFTDPMSVEAARAWTPPSEGA